MIKYLGSKRTLVPNILALVDRLPDVHRVCDLFTGTTRVAQALKEQGYFVVANDLATYSYEMSLAFIEADVNTVDIPRLEAWLALLEALPGTRGYVTRTFCEESRFFHPKNGVRIDAIRDEIERLDTTPHERAILLTTLMLAADRVDSTTGLQMAYLKSWAPRAHNDLELRLPKLLSGKGTATRQDAVAFVESGGTRDVDLTYIDPPYNQHSYFGNYHIWETLMRNDAPEAYGVARKRIDTRENRSAFNSKREFAAAFERTIMGVESPYLLVSFNNEGYISAADMVRLLSAKGHVVQLDVDFRRYVGARIGIHNPAGEKVGRVSHVRNTEHLFLVGERDAVEGAACAMPPEMHAHAVTGPVHAATKPGG
jgi:adenine-specific DNA-methyltransferase